MFFLIIGLGNPGDDYRDSRHNAGFQVVDRLAARHGIAMAEEPRFEARVGRGELNGRPVILLEPLTYMNLSGRAVLPVSQAFSVDVDRMAVLHDDMDLDLGRIQVRRGGGDGGHRGIRSIVAHLESADFVRLRLGVGRPDQGQDAAEHVLAAMAEPERQAMETMIDRAAEAVVTWMEQGLQTAMNRFNPWKRPERKETPEARAEGEAADADEGEAEGS